MRDIEIYELELLDFNNKDEITFKCRVSKGTYIRVLGETIAEKLGNLGHLISLRRTMVGPFKVEDAIEISEVNENKLIDTYDVLSKCVDIVELNDEDAFRASHGVIFKKDISDKRDIVVMVDKNHMVIAIYKYQDEKFICLRGINDYGNNSI